MKILRGCLKSLESANRTPQSDMLSGGIEGPFLNFSKLHNSKFVQTLENMTIMTCETFFVGNDTRIRLLYGRKGFLKG